MRALVESECAHICSIFEPNPEMARAANELARTAEIVNSFEQLLDAGADAIVIATPSALHAEQAIAALEHGAAVFCQKPLGRNAIESRRTIEAAQAADRLLHVDFSYRFITGVQKIKELVRSGSLGEIYAAELVFHNAYGPDKPWFYDPKLSGGGCLIDLGVHLVDLGLWVLDFPEVSYISSRIFCNGRRFSNRQQQVEDFAMATMDCATGTRMNIACSWKAHAGRDAIIEATFYGTRGGAKLRNVNGSFHDFITERFEGTRTEILTSQPEEWGGLAAVNWLARLCNIGNGFDGDVWHVNTVASILDRIYES